MNAPYLSRSALQMLDVHLIERLLGQCARSNPLAFRRAALSGFHMGPANYSGFSRNPRLSVANQATALKAVVHWTRIVDIIPTKLLQGYWPGHGSEFG